MAVLSVTVPDEQVDRVRAAFATRVRKEFVDVTAADVEADLVDYVKNVVRQYEEDVAARAAFDGVSDLDAT
jgi:hypothetical protein